MGSHFSNKLVQCFRTNSVNGVSSSFASGLFECEGLTRSMVGWSGEMTRFVAAPRPPRSIAFCEPPVFGNDS